MKLVAADAPRDPALFYGAACLPTVRGMIWECASRAEYNALRDAYEAEEGNCNTCVHLQRVKHERDPLGFLQGTCARDGLPLLFHPEDPLQVPCHEQRLRAVKGTPC